MPRRLVKPASKPIKAVLKEFLADQRERLKSTTLRRYESVIELFEASMDGYAYQYLDEAETALFEARYNAEGEEHREFCELFGPEKIPENVGEFLGYFMPRKVLCGKDLLRAAGTVTRKLGRWLAERGYVGDENAEAMSERGAHASKNLPAAATLSDMLAAHAAASSGRVSETVEGHFDVLAIGEASLGLREMMQDAKVTVPVPPAAARLCQPGWRISGCVGRTPRGWRLVEVWNVYA